MPKSKYKHFKDISKRHFNRLVKKETEQNLSPSTSRSNENQCASVVQISSIENVIQCGSEMPDEIGQFKSMDQFCSISDDRDDSYVHYSSIIEDGNESGSSSSENSVSFINDSRMHENVSNSDVTNSSVINCSQNYISNLAKWAVKYQVKCNAINALLEIQRKEPGYESLPKDSRTLLKTHRSTVIRKFDPGEYYHFGLEYTLDLFNIPVDSL